MRPLVPEDLVDLAIYRDLRDAYRGAVIDHKRRRRMAVGDRATLLFEDRETLRFQVLEMLFVERIEAPQKIQHELDVYNELMPAPDELSATLFLEITDAQEIRAELDRMIGLDEHVSLELGAGDAPLRVDARFDPKQMEEDRISAVHYLRFPLGDAGARALRDPEVPAAIRVDHPAYRVRAPLPPEVRESLAAGLREDPPALLDPARLRRGETAERLLHETPHVRVVAPARPAAPGHVVAVLREDTALLRASDAAWHELMDVVRDFARRLRDEHGACRIVAEVEDDALPARVQLLPAPPRAR